MRSMISLAALFAAIPALAQPADTAPVDAIFARFSGQATPGCAVGVARNGETILRRGYGSADLEHAVEITPDTVFEAGSVSKQFTAAAILLLVEEGKLRLTDDVRAYVPELPDYGAKITIDHLLNHTSGLRDWGVVMTFAGWPRGTRHYTMDDVLAVIARQTALNHAPGAEYSYTNSGYNLLAIIVQRVSGSSLAEFSRTRMFVPLGMRSTSWRDDYRRVVPGRAVAYAPAAAGAFVQAMPFEDSYGNGGLLTTVQDLLTWNEALTSGRLGARVTQLLAEQGRLNGGRQIRYARGLEVQAHRGQPEISHNGATGGYRTYLGRFPQSRLSVALLCNAANASPDAAYQVADLYLPAAPATPPQAPAAATAPVDAGLAGAFVSEKDGTILRLTAEAGALRLAGAPPLQPIGPGRFRIGSAELRADGRERLVLTLPDGETVRYARAAAFAPAAADLTAYTGRYHSAEAGAAYLLRVENGVLVAQLEERPQIKLPMMPAYPDAFESVGAILRFRRDARGRVASLGIGQGRVRDLSFVRTGDAPAVAQPPAR
jgi:CubicO group peptidase (beta-lactamase class C family)